MVGANYYKCLRGDCENLGLTEPDSFVVRDARARTWICHPVSEEDVETLSLLDCAADTMAGDAALRKLGLSRQGTEVRVYYCEDEQELTEKLGQN
jgi:hypothetical protein